MWPSGGTSAPGCTSSGSASSVRKENQFRTISAVSVGTVTKMQCSKALACHTTHFLLSM